MVFLMSPQRQARPEPPPVAPDSALGAGSAESSAGRPGAVAEVLNAIDAIPNHFSEAAVLHARKCAWAWMKYVRRLERKHATLLRFTLRLRGRVTLGSVSERRRLEVLRLAMYKSAGEVFRHEWARLKELERDDKLGLLKVGGWQQRARLAYFCTMESISKHSGLPIEKLLGNRLSPTFFEREVSLL